MYINNSMNTNHILKSTKATGNAMPHDKFPIKKVYWFDIFVVLTFIEELQYNYIYINKV